MRHSVFFPLLAVWSLISSCSQQIYSHEEVMQSFDTKKGVINQFGQPDETMSLNLTTQWLYNCDTLSNFARTKTKVKINGIYNPAAGFHSVPTSVKQFSSHKRFVKFIFNKEGKVLGWSSSGLNYAERRSTTLATLAIVAGSAFAVALVIGTIELATDGIF